MPPASILTAKNAAGITYGIEDDTAPKQGGAYVNTDHTYELKMLKYFFEDDAPDNAADPAGCFHWQEFWLGEINAESLQYGKDISQSFFFKNMPAWSRIQTIFKLLPGMLTAFARSHDMVYQAHKPESGIGHNLRSHVVCLLIFDLGSANPAWADFVGMDRDMNRMKGLLLVRNFAQELESFVDTKQDKTSQWIGVLNRMGEYTVTTRIVPRVIECSDGYYAGCDSDSDERYCTRPVLR